ncbi:hypothetical protein VcPa08_01821 [Vibrio cholerae]|nr:hypothetical protein VcPa01_02112 [Vibrio cholerae]GFK41019.1 hypothetical protein VcPa03_02112 [Vibrio cholerae]GFK44489.1 hypothetical protein VcPa04_02029 [Vibrio cholerae]GFK51436.1 hypothetical protein VcPa06_01874 [Vibrio cholerae]GFK58486.1 hypothetical protein VcPa08_01821 [Vibrio cholerae]
MEFVNYSAHIWLDVNKDTIAVASQGWQGEVWFYGNILQKKTLSFV